MKNNLKTIITCILIAAILITGINTGNAVTVNAAAQYKQLNDGATITLKPGDAKKFLVLNSDGKDISYQYRWSSSNPEIVGVDNDFFDDYNGQYVELTARSIGKATITGVGRGTYSDVKEGSVFKVTVTVKQAGPTAKQKKCKHSWKTTKKATCERVGVKTCKKCKLQKTIAKTSHKWATSNKQVIEGEREDIVFYCMGCHCENIPAGVCGIDYHFDTQTKCPHPCTVRFSTEDYGTPEACKEAWANHHKTCGNNETGCNGGTKSCNGTTYASTVEYTGGHTVTKKVKVCMYCGKEKE